MKSNVGLWIDHRKAIIVRMRGGAEEIHTIVSEMEKHVRYSGGEPEDLQDHRFTEHLKKYYAKVISFLRESDSILLLGPGEAKGEFEKRLNADSCGARVVGIETADKMTCSQIAAKVRKHFLNSEAEIRQSKNRKVILTAAKQEVKEEHS